MAKTNWLKLYVERVFSLDMRSLAIFRIALGALIISDLFLRWPAITDMFTGQGLFTKELSLEFYEKQFGTTNFFWSLYWISDSVTYVYGLLFVAFVSAIFLIVGKWTRLATFLSWLLLASIHVRNPLVTTSGDFLFKMMLFWSIFLPLGAKWSLDARQRENGNTNAIVSAASIGYVFQVFAIYFFSGIAKWNSIWLDGEAMDFVMRLNIYVRDFGKYLLEFPELLVWTTWLTLGAEVFFIWTIFVYWKNSTWRLLNLGMFWAFHIGIALSLAIGMFPWICIVAWLALIPASAWNLFAKSESYVVENLLDWHKLPTARLAIEGFCTASFLIVVAWNIANIDHPIAQKFRLPLLKQLGVQMAVDQHFKMFGEPPSENPWFVYEGQLPDGSKVDLWRNAEIDLERPESGLKIFPEFHWRKFHRNALSDQLEFVRQPMLEYVVEKWNDRNPDKKVVTARLICFTEPIGPDYQEKSNISTVWARFGNPDKKPGSVFDSFLQEDDDFQF